MKMSICENKDLHMPEKLNGKMNSSSAERMHGLDLLRCIAMMMVVVLHFLDKGKILPDLGVGSSRNALGITAWVLESVCAIAVNIYMLISGYVLCEAGYKVSRLVKMYLQLWFYSAGIGAVAILAGIVPAAEIDTYRILQLILPVSMGHYWFMTAYVYFYLFLPLLGMAVKKMNRKQHKITVVMLLLAHCVLKSVLPVRLEMDGIGYDFLWYCVMFLVASYIRKYSPSLFSKKNSVIFFMAGVFGAFAEVVAIGFVREKFGALELLKSVSMEYNHIFLLIGSLGLFGLFKDMKLIGKAGRAISAVSAYTLGVYLLHENINVRYAWQAIFSPERVNSVMMLIGVTLLAAITVFTCGIIVDALRSVIFAGLHKLFMHVKPYKKLSDALCKADEVFKND